MLTFEPRLCVPGWGLPGREESCTTDVPKHLHDKIMMVKKMLTAVLVLKLKLANPQRLVYALCFVPTSFC